MDIWKQIEILNKKDNTWSFSKGNTEEKIEALSIIAKEGSTRHIYYLIEFLKDNNKEIRDLTCNTIIHLFNKLNSKKGYYNTLKHCNIFENDIDFYKANFTTNQYTELLSICSLNENGYIREEAVKRLSKIDNPQVIQFIIYRLSDWVPQVRQVAVKAIKNFLTREYISNLIENLPLFIWLQQVERVDLCGIYQDIITFIVTKNREYIISNFKFFPDKLRLILAKEVSSNLINKSNELKLILNDKNYLIRVLAINHIESLDKSIINKLLCDKSAKVRLETLYKLKNEIGFKELVIEYLADNSSTIRYFARFTLSNTNFNIIKYYYQNLMNENQVIGSMLGLSEMGATQCSAEVKKFLTNDRVKIRKAAFVATQKLDVNSAYEFALANIDTTSVGIRNVVIKYLSQCRNEVVLIKAREIYQFGDIEIRKDMLKLFLGYGSWKVLPDLMYGTIDENEELREIAFKYLNIWKERAVKLFSQPQPQDIDRFYKIFELTYKAHFDKQYFLTNPIEGLDFYYNKV